MESVGLQPTVTGDPFVERQMAVTQAGIALAAVSQDAEWNEHEHTAPVVIVQAEHLLQRAGSAELAKHAIDVAARQNAETPALDDLP